MYPCMCLSGVFECVHVHGCVCGTRRCEREPWCACVEVSIPWCVSEAAACDLSEWLWEVPLSGCDVCVQVHREPLREAGGSAFVDSTLS